jgi:enterobactin synthetase component D
MHLSLTPAAATAGGRAGWPAIAAASLPVTICRSPEVVSPPVRQCSLTFDPFDVVEAAAEGAHDGYRLEGLEHATAARRFEFVAGRSCVADAMRALGLRGTVGRRPDGTPAWPAGVTGSITHTHGFVSAAVASTAEVGAIGIDSETILTAGRACRIGRVFASADEIAAAVAAGLDRETAVTLIFSAKESLFKALHASVRRIFDFHDVQLTHVDVGRGRFMTMVRNTLSPRFSAGSTLAGAFEIDARRVHTGMVVPTVARE